MRDSIIAIRARVKDPVSGFSHLGGCVLALAGLVALFVYARNSTDMGGRACVLVYGVCLVALYAASSAYHLVIADERMTRALRLFDHIAIFTMIAGTCTPLYYFAFSGTTRLVMISGIWGAALVGILFKITWRTAPRVLYTSVYVAMSWGLVIRGPALVAALPASVCALVVAGGLTYTAGAIVYAVRRPDPFPSIFGFHEIWHLFVLGGSALHFGAIALLA
jgi:hemolysin III